jgi:RimJ/RimL family protein N-acetyltransferase
MPTIVSTDPAQSPSKHRETRSASAVVTSDNSYPTLSARRFQFRPFALTDVAQLATLAGEHRIADTHPYTWEFARDWIRSHSAAWWGRRALQWAALRVGGERIVGYAGLNEIDMERGQAEMRFWVGCGVERK